jgi:hypothetical protein
MVSLTESSSRVLRLAVVLLPVLLGTGMHDWLHSSDAAPGSACHSGQIELHATDCGHHGPLSEARGTECLVCKTSSRRVALPLDDRAAADVPTCTRIALATVAHIEPHSIIPGVLGARAPPVTTG